VRSPRRFAVMTIPASAVSYLMVSSPQLAVLIYILLATAVFSAALLALPAVWSRKKYRRDAAYGLVKLILGSRKG
jgi:uncharacterized membrane protein